MTREADGFSDLIAHYDSIQSYLERRVRCFPTAADLAQDTYVRALRYYDARAPPKDPRAWLRGIALNVARDYFNGLRGRALDIDDLCPSVATDAREHGPLEVLVASEDEDRVRELADGLPDAVRSLVKGYYWEGKGCRELAEETGIHYENVKSRLYRARKKLKTHLDSRA